MAIFCVKCGAKNPDGAQFCWRCGERLPRRRSEPIPEEEFVTPEEEERRFRDLLDRAFELSQRGEVDEAVSACEEALKLRPTATTALSLLGSLYERRGERDRAVECYRKVVLLDPNAAAERERLRELGEEVPVPEAPPRRRRASAALGIASAALLLSLVVAATVAGYRYVKSSSRPKPVEVAAGVHPSEVPPPPSFPQARYRLGPGGTWGYGTPPQTVPTPPSSRKVKKVAEREGKRPKKAARQKARAEAETIPPARVEAVPPVTAWRPLAPYYGGYYAPTPAPRYVNPSWPARREVPAPPRAAMPPSREVAPRPGGAVPPLGARPSVARRPSAGPTARPQVAPPRPRIGIVVERPSPPPPEEIARAEEAEGHRRYLAGDYQAAIAHYRKALSLAKDSLQRAQLLQRLGDAYRDSGDFESARLQYRNAIEEYRKAMREGAADEARRGIAACKAALEVIGG